MFLKPFKTTTKILVQRETIEKCPNLTPNDMEQQTKVEFKLFLNMIKICNFSY